MRTPVWQRGGANLRPLTMADILDGTFRLLKECWKPLGLLTLLLAVPAAVISAVMQAASTNFGAQPSLYSALFGGGDVLATAEEPLSVAAIVTVFGSYLITLALAVTVQPLLLGAMTKIVAATYMGTSLAPMTALKSTVRQWPTLIAASLLAGVAIGVGLLFCIIGMVVPATLLFLYTPVIAIENAGPIKALERSFFLTKPRFWWYLLTLALMYFLAYTVSNVLATPFVIAFFGGAALGIGVLEWVSLAIATLVQTVLVVPILVVLAVLVYFDARVRVEGLDIQLAASRGTPTA